MNTGKNTQHRTKKENKKKTKLKRKQTRIIIITHLGICALIQPDAPDDIRAGPDVPALHVFAGKEKMHLPRSREELLDGSYVCLQEKGSVTCDIFCDYLEKVLIPFVERSAPGGLLVGVREAMITIDLPAVHKLPARILHLCRSKGIHLYHFSHNTTSWSQPCHSSYCFGSFKKAYYYILDQYLQGRQRQGDHSGKVHPSVIPRLIKKAWSCVTDNRKIAAFADCGLVIGNTTKLQQMREDFQGIVLARASDASSKNSKKRKKLGAHKQTTANMHY